MAMGIKCSLLGHSFGDTTVEREREEDGTEVVITIREFETCERCDETRIVSENKEVTTLETPADPAGDAAGDDQPPGGTDEALADTSADTTTDASTDATTGAADAGDDGGDAEIIDAGPEDTAETDAQAEARTDAEPVIPDAEGGAEGGAETAAGEDVTAAEDDAVIIDGEDDDPEPDRDPGEWPDEPDEQTASVTDREWPEETKAPERTRGDGPAEAEQSDASEWPDATQPPEAGDATLEDVTDAGGQASVTVPEGMFKCSECGFTTEASSSAHRAGDFCPECHHGTLLTGEDADE